MLLVVLWISVHYSSEILFINLESCLFKINFVLYLNYCILNYAGVKKIVFGSEAISSSTFTLIVSDVSLEICENIKRQNATGFAPDPQTPQWIESVIQELQHLNYINDEKMCIF